MLKYFDGSVAVVVVYRLNGNGSAVAYRQSPLSICHLPIARNVSAKNAACVCVCVVCVCAF